MIMWRGRNRKFLNRRPSDFEICELFTFLIYSTNCAIIKFTTLYYKIDDMGFPKYFEDIGKLRDEYYNYSDRIKRDLPEINTQQELKLLRTQIDERLKNLEKYVNEIYELGTSPEFDLLQELKRTRSKLDEVTTENELLSRSTTTKFSRLEQKICTLNKNLEDQAKLHKNIIDTINKKNQKLRREHRKMSLAKSDKIILKKTNRSSEEPLVKTPKSTKVRSFRSKKSKAMTTYEAYPENKTKKSKEGKPNAFRDFFNKTK